MSRPDRCQAAQTEPSPSVVSAQAGHELARGLRAAYLTMHRRANAALAPFELTADQFVLLTALAEGDGVTQKELGWRTHSDPNTMSEMLGRLERKGLVVRERHADDGRALRVSLTETGRAAQRRALEGADAFCEALAGFVPGDEVETLVSQLNRIARGMSAADSPPALDPGVAQATPHGAKDAPQEPDQHARP